jgi:hypothetical protein
LYELNEEFAQTGRSFRDIIADDYGKFEIKNVELVSPYAMLEADGFYRNEVTGQTSTAPIKLYAIADIREKDNVNVNLLTHLEYYRVLNLVENGKTVAEAKKQAQKEILAVFGINGDGFENSEDMSIFGTTEGDAALLAISILLQGDLSEGDFSQRLTDFAQSIKEGGTWENEAVKNAIAYWASGRYAYINLDCQSRNNNYCGSYQYCNIYRYRSGSDLDDIRSNVLKWGLSSEIPNFEKYISDYLAVFHGLYVCDAESQGNVEISKDGISYFICKNGIWQWPSTREIDVPALGDCSAENEFEEKEVSNIGVETNRYETNRYICDGNAWNRCTEYNNINYSCLSVDGERRWESAEWQNQCDWRLINEKKLRAEGVSSWEVYFGWRRFTFF